MKTIKLDPLNERLIGLRQRHALASQRYRLNPDDINRVALVDARKALREAENAILSSALPKVPA